MGTLYISRDILGVIQTAGGTLPTSSSPAQSLWDQYLLSHSCLEADGVVLSAMKTVFSAPAACAFLSVAARRCMRHAGPTCPGSGPGRAKRQPDPGDRADLKYFDLAPRLAMTSGYVFLDWLGRALSAKIRRRPRLREARCVPRILVPSAGDHGNWRNGIFVSLHVTQNSLSLFPSNYTNFAVAAVGVWACEYRSSMHESRRPPGARGASLVNCFLHRHCDLRPSTK